MGDWADDAEDEHAVPWLSGAARAPQSDETLPSSPTLASADVTVVLPFVEATTRSLAIQAKRAVLVKNALVASNVVACSVASLVRVVQENVREGGAAVECDEYMEMLRLLPEIRGSEAFLPLEDTLRRLYRSFHASNKLDLVMLGVGSLLLVHGATQEKLYAAVRLARGAGQEEGPLLVSKPTLTTALSCLLLGVSALFDHAEASEEELHATSAIVDESARETVNHAWTAIKVEDEDDVSVDRAWEWIQEKMPRKLSWLKLVDSAKWPTTQRLTSPPTSPPAPQSPTREAQARDHDAPPFSEAPTTNGEENGPSTLNFQFSETDSGFLRIGEPEASDLFELLRESAFTRIDARAMYDTFVQHTGDGLLEDDTFMEAVKELVSTTSPPLLAQQECDFFEDMHTIFRCFLPEHGIHADAIEVAAGFSLFTRGSKSEKLQAGFHYFDVDGKGFLNRQQMWRFLRSVLTMLLFLSPPHNDVITRHGSIADLVDTGEEKIIEFIMDGIGDDDDNERQHSMSSDVRMGVFTFEAFAEWYNMGGYTELSWLELLDLRKWTFLSPDFQLEELDDEPVDSVASSEYYTAQNNQSEVEQQKIKRGAPPPEGYPHAIQEDDDEDGEYEGEHHGEFVHSGSSFSSATTYNSTPALLLMHTVMLEFELPFDGDDDAAEEIPLGSLMFHNGDLLQYRELQRVVRLYEVPLADLYGVFEPYMDATSTAWIEKSAFDECMKNLLPPNVAEGVASSFGIPPNSQVIPPSIGQPHEYKMVADTLSRLFFAFNRGGTGKIDLVELMVGMSIFCAGSKSEKLIFAYRLFDTDEDGALKRREMWRYLRSFLTVLLALGNGSELSAEALASVVDATAVTIANAMFRDTNKPFSVREAPSYPRPSNRFSLDTPDSAETVVASRNRQLRRGQYYHRSSLPSVGSVSLSGAGVSGPGAGRSFVRGGAVSLQEFGAWYSAQGHNYIAWIELLDTKKWPQVSDDVADTILRYISRQQRAIAGMAARGSLGSMPDSGVNVSTGTSSGGSHVEEGRTSSLEAEYSPDEMTTLNTASLLGTEGKQSFETTMESIAGVRVLINSPSSTASSAKNLNSVGLQFKLTNFDDTVLKIRLKDVATVYMVAERMGFRALSCKDLLGVFDSGGRGRSLTKSGFLRVMREYVPRDSLTNEDQEFLSFHLLRVFALFEVESANDDDSDDEDENGSSSNGANNYRRTSSVEKLHLMAGMSIFCGGSKSAKLGVLFQQFDVHGDGYVSRWHISMMFKSILVVLFAFSSFNSSRAHTNDTNINTWSTNSVAERVAGALTAEMFCTAQCRNPDSISLEEFAKWYAGGGYLHCPWVELLDLTKWPAKEAFEASKAEKPLYGFEANEDETLLHFSESDISTYLFMLRSTKLSELNVSKLYDELLAYAVPSAQEIAKRSRAQRDQAKTGEPNFNPINFDEDQGSYLVLTRSSFYECIRTLVPKEDMSEKAQQTSSKMLSRIFNVFDRTKCGRANALELACGLSILGKGSKSQKLSLAFDFILKMRIQRTRTLNLFANSSSGGSGALGGGGFNNVSTTGGVSGWLTSARGAMSTASGMRRTGFHHEPDALPVSVVYVYLRSFLLALMALSDTTYRLGLERMHSEADDFIEEAINDLMSEVAGTGSNSGYNGFGTRSQGPGKVTFEQFGEWYNTSGYHIISWIELLDVRKWEMEQEAAALSRTAAGRYASSRSQRHIASTRLVEPVDTSKKPRTTQKKHVRQSEIAYGLYNEVLEEKAVKPAHQETGVLSTDGPFMVFAIDEQAAEMHFFMDDVRLMKAFMQETQLCDRTARAVSESLLAALNLEDKAEIVSLSLADAVQNAFIGGRDLSADSAELLDAVLRVFSEERVPTSGYASTGVESKGIDEDELFATGPIDVRGAICGLFAFCDGSLLEKIKAATQLFDETASAHPSETPLETIHECLKCMLMAFYGMTCGLAADAVRESAERGAEAVLRAFLGSDTNDEETMSPTKRAKRPPLDLSPSVTLEEFNEWLRDSGERTFPWLELTELAHWPGALDVRGVATSEAKE